MKLAAIFMSKNLYIYTKPLTVSKRTMKYKSIVMLKIFC